MGWDKRQNIPAETPCSFVFPFFTPPPPPFHLLPLCTLCLPLLKCNVMGQEMGHPGQKRSRTFFVWFGPHAARALMRHDTTTKTHEHLSDAVHSIEMFIWGRE